MTQRKSKRGGEAGRGHLGLEGSHLNAAHARVLCPGSRTLPRPSPHRAARSCFARLAQATGGLCISPRGGRDFTVTASSSPRSPVPQGRTQKPTRVTPIGRDRAGAHGSLEMPLPRSAAREAPRATRSPESPKGRRTGGSKSSGPGAEVALAKAETCPRRSGVSRGSTGSAPARPAWTSHRDSEEASDPADLPLGR